MVLGGLTSFPVLCPYSLYRSIQRHACLLKDKQIPAHPYCFQNTTKHNLPLHVRSLSITVGQISFHSSKKVTAIEVIPHRAQNKISPNLLHMNTVPKCMNNCLIIIVAHSAHHSASSSFVSGYHS
ncbi:hypothetical protein RIF29_10969 [Crotalaria pallida]|uniref:Uncharacterized protein n=1 Tax=Crotalaria pallida TaxID=3830 RepID=A0AAN9G0F8_CROPI